MGRPKVTDSTRKRTRRRAHMNYDAGRVSIGSEITRWNELRGVLGMNNAAFAAHLIEFYMGKVAAPCEGTGGSLPQLTSTPAARPMPLQQLSDVSSVERSSSSDISGVEPIESPDSSGEQETCSHSSKDRPITKGWSDKDIVIDIQDAGEYLDADDPSYVPDLDMSFSFHENVETEDYIGVEELVHPVPDDQDIEYSEDQEEKSKEKSHLHKLNGVSEKEVKEQMFLITESQLLSLASHLKFDKCCAKGCNKNIKIYTQSAATGVYLRWKCAAGHVVYSWCSQSLLPYNILLGNFMVLAAILLSGNNYAKIALWSKFINLKMPSITTFSRLQTHYLVPEVERYWFSLRDETIDSVKGHPVVVLGDGRMDSPGHSAKYCTYTVMDMSTKAILTQEVVDKRQTGLNSATMEAKGFNMAMETLVAKGVGVVEVVTDAHMQIQSMMKKQHPTWKHSFDMWHGVKNIGKKLAATAAERGNQDLKPWMKHILNHFWYCSRQCDGNVDLFRNKWISVLHHVRNCHTSIFGKCDHDELGEDADRETEWLTDGSTAHTSLRKLVFSDRLMKTLPYYVNCQTTAEIESFNNHILMYASKRQAFTYPVYKCRSQLAAIDYQKHLNLPLKKNKDGSQRYHRCYSKASNNWTARPVKVAKEYNYIPELLKACINSYCTEGKNKPLRSAVQLKPDDPRRIAQTIAKRPPPSTSEIVQSKKTRLKEKS